MTKLDRPEPGTVTWADLQTPDLDKARQFYGALLGWSFVGGDDPNTHFYTMAQLGGRNVVGLSKLVGSLPPVWSVYLASDNVDETARKVGEAGGQTAMAPMNVMEEGRMALFVDPTGAHFGVWQSKKHKGAEVVDEVGAMTWHEVYTRDAAQARAFYQRVFSLEDKRFDAPNMAYWTLHKGPKTVCGLMQMTEHFPKEVPSHWNTYFAVSDADAAAKKAASLGGKVLAPPFDTPYGRMTVVTDPFGAPFCLIKPVQPPGT